MTPHPTLDEIRSTHGAKYGYERYMPVSRYLFRPLAFRAAWLALRLHASSEVVSWLSTVVGVAGLLVLVAGDGASVYAGVLLLMLFNLLDGVDGTLARVLRTSNPYGRFLDAVCGAAVDLPFWAAVGVMLFRNPAFGGGVPGLAAPPSCALWLGGGTALIAALLHEVEREYEALLDPVWRPTGPPVGPPARFADDAWLRIVARNLRVRETHYVLLVVAMLLRRVDVLLVVQLAYYAIALVAAVAAYSARGREVRARGARGVEAPR